MNQKTVCFYPSNQKRTNHFLFNLSRLLESTGRFRCVGYKEIQKECPGKLFQADIYHINWFDQSKNVVSFCKRLYFLFALKLKGKRIVWTIHNIVSHAKTPFYNKILFKVLARFSDVIHVMCKDTVSVAGLEKYQDKVKLVPHGDYYGSYPDKAFDVCEYYGIGKDKPVFLFSGAIQPYKNVDVLIKAFRKAFPGDDAPSLLICGKVEPDSYKNSIQQMLSGCSNIVFDPQFVPDDLLGSYIKTASVLVVPYSYRSSLNSGTIPLAFSYGKTLVCPDIACVKDIVAESDCLYSYHYESEEEHVVRLSEKMLQVCTDLKNGEIFKKEENAKRYMAENSWESKKMEWIALYEAVSC